IRQSKNYRNSTLLFSGAELRVCNAGIGKARIGSRNEARAAIEREVGKGPLNRNQDAALKFHDIEQVDEQPEQPRKEAAEVELADLGHRALTSDSGEVPLIEIVERLRRFAAQASGDETRGVASLLHGGGRHPRHLLTVFLLDACEIADDENFRMAGN